MATASHGDTVYRDTQDATPNTHQDTWTQSQISLTEGASVADQS